MSLLAPFVAPSKPALRALTEVTLANFENRSIRLTDSETDALTGLVERFLCHAISFDSLCRAASQIVSDIHPLSMLQAVDSMSPDPIPFSDDDVGRHGTRRCGRYWSTYEDQRLLAGILRFGIENWTSIAAFVGNGRSRSQCSQRWYRGLNPSVVKGQWSKEEEERLVELVRSSGDQSWTKIALQLGNRSDVQCRYRYHQLLKEQGSPISPNFVPLMMMPLAVAPFQIRMPYPPPMHSVGHNSPLVMNPVAYQMAAVPSPHPAAMAAIDPSRHPDQQCPDHAAVAHSLTAPAINGRRYSVY
jgi:hypothetical protein